MFLFLQRHSPGPILTLFQKPAMEKGGSAGETPASHISSWTQNVAQDCGPQEAVVVVQVIRDWVPATHMGDLA